MALVDYTPSRDAAIEAMGSPRLLEWFAEHKVDGNTVPLNAIVELDPITNEWRIEQYVRGEHGIRVDPATGNPMRRVLRRAVKSLPPWVGVG